MKNDLQLVPCRASIDTQAHYADLAQSTPPGFSEWDDALMHDLMGNERMGQATKQLLITHSELRRGGMDQAKALEALMDAVQKFRESCVDEWRDRL